MRARYDAAQYSLESAKHWAEADQLSARAANDPAVRAILRRRARYERDNNSYLKGITDTLANDMVGTGPRLQMLTPDQVLNREIESAVADWACAIDLAGKSQLMKKDSVINGEAVGLMVTNKRLRMPVQLDLRVIEADRLATPYPFFPTEYEVDGIKFDKAFNPISYSILDQHPGDTYQYHMITQAQNVAADLVTHWFQSTRAEQYRGIPEITAALPLFAQIRRYTLAVAAAAETAADFAAVIYSEMPPDGDSIDADPFDTLDIDRRMMTTLPAGWKMSQFRAEQPTTTYVEFRDAILNEIARCLSIPFNVAAGNSSGYNYSSGRLDHQVYHRMLKVTRASFERVVLNPLLFAWLENYRDAVGLIPSAVDIRTLPHQWLWPGMEHVDPQKEADAQVTRLQNGLTSFSEECHRQGIDPETRAATIAKDQQLFESFGIEPPWLTSPKTSTSTPQDQTTPPEEPPATPANRSRSRGRNGQQPN